MDPMEINIGDWVMERVYLRVIKKKYQNMRNNVGNNIRETYFRELLDQVHRLIHFVI